MRQSRKIDALLRCIGSDGRVRGSLLFHKASTGRWAGALYQPQNLKRVEADEADIEAAIAAVMTGDYAHVAGLYPRVLSVLGDLGRSLICAAPGSRADRRRLQCNRKPCLRLGCRRGMEARCPSPCRCYRGST